MPAEAKGRILLLMLERRLCTVLPLIAVLGSCGPRATEGGFDSANPAADMYAMEQAVQAADRRALPDIIEHLGSDDPAVRLVAIESLRRLTHRTFGYDPDAPPPLRDAARERWLAAWRSGNLTADADSADVAGESHE